MNERCSHAAKAMVAAVARSASVFFLVFLLFTTHVTPWVGAFAPSGSTLVSSGQALFGKKVFAFDGVRRTDQCQLSMSTAAAAAAIKTPAAWVAICGKLAPFTSVCVSMAPLPTILQVTQEKSVGDLPLLPYSTLMAYAFVWVMYGE